MTTINSDKAARVGLATCAALPLGDGDESSLVDALSEEGAQSNWIIWSSTDPTTLHQSVDLLILRNTWDYVEDRSAFLAWVDACSVPVLNPAHVVRWNSNKNYMLDLLEDGVPTVPTQIVETVDQKWSAPTGYEEIVVKPAIGAGSRGASRFRVGDEIDDARRHVVELIASGNIAVVQPYLPSVDAGSETALIHIDGQFAHSVTKGPMLRRDGGGEWVEGLYLAEEINHRDASEQQLVVARAAMEAVPTADLLYARVDLVDDVDGAPLVLELELIEPSLFFAFDPASAKALAAAIVGRL